MKKRLILFLMLLVLVISGCSNQESNATADKSKTDTITYESENGAVEVPADPKRVVVISTFSGNVMALYVHLVGVDVWFSYHPRFITESLDDQEVTEESQ